MGMPNKLDRARGKNSSALRPARVQPGGPQSLLPGVEEAVACHEPALDGDELGEGLLPLDPARPRLAAKAAERQHTVAQIERSGRPDLPDLERLRELLEPLNHAFVAAIARREPERLELLG